MSNHHKDFVKARLDRRTLLEQLAEEASELSKAALKCIRAEGLSNNPTPVSMGEANDNLLEEFHDVIAVAELLNLVKVEGVTDNNPKWERWAERIMNGRA